MSAGPKPNGYYDTVRGINWISGYAIKKLLAHGPTAQYLMGITKKPGIAYDVAYSAEETIAIGLKVAASQGLNTTDIFTERMSENTAASLWYIVQKNYPKPDISQIYKIEIPYSPGNDKSFAEWCESVKGRLPHNGREKIEWFMEWKAAGHF
jgi:hypothetical protein